MNLKELLNSDLGAAGQMLRAGFDWWVAELAELVPASLRAGGRRRAPILAHVADDGASFRLTRDGAELGRVAGPGRGGGQVDIVLSPAQALTREVELPILPAKDTRRLLALDLDRLTPLPADAIYHDAEVIARHPAEGRQRAFLGVVPRATAEAIVARAEAYGLTPQAMSVADPADGTLRLDLLRAMRTGAAGGASDRRKAFWWTAAAGLMAINVVLLVARDMADVNQLREAVGSQRATVGAATRMRQRVIGESTARAALVARQERNEPLRVVNAVTIALPPGAWVQRFEWNGRSVRITGHKPAGFDLMAALRASPVLANPRALGGDVPTGSNASQPFDVSADVREPVR
jgi:general secretion pathway protein L